MSFRGGAAVIMSAWGNPLFEPLVLVAQPACRCRDGQDIRWLADADPRSFGASSAIPADTSNPRENPVAGARR